MLPDYYPTLPGYHPYQALFKELDADHSGYLDEAEIGQVAARLGFLCYLVIIPCYLVMTLCYLVVPPTRRRHGWASRSRRGTSCRPQQYVSKGVSYGE